VDAMIVCVDGYIIKLAYSKYGIKREVVVTFLLKSAITKVESNEMD
jgi:hypothetical protein